MTIKKMRGGRKMKKIAIFSLIIGLFLVLALQCVSAAASMQIADIELGGENQDKSNPEEDENAYAQRTITITNNGDENLTNIDLSTTLATKFNATLTPDSIATLDVDESKTFILKILVPKDISAFYPDRDNAQEDRILDIGSLEADADQTTKTADISLETENKLEIKRLYVKIGSKEEKVDDEDEVEDVEPGNDVIVRIIAENKFTSSENVEIEDVEFSIEIDEGDLDVDEEEDMGDIKEGDEDEVDVTFEIDEDVEDETYTMIVLLKGTDEYGATHGETWEINLEVKREDEKIEILSVELNPATLSCEREATLTVKLENQGADDSDDIILIVEEEQLKIYSRTLKMDLEEGDETTKRIPIKVDENAAAGVYSIDVMTYFDLKDLDNDVINEYDSVDIRIENCGGTSTKPADTSNDTDNNPDPTDTGSDDDDIVVTTTTDTGSQAKPISGVPSVGDVKISPTKKESAFGKGTYTALIILAYVIVVGLIIYLIASMLMKK